MVTNPSVFDVIERLSENLPLEPAKVGEILGVPLEHDPEGDTPVMTSYTQPAGVSDSRFKAVDLRIPHPVFGRGAGLLSATLKDDEGLDAKAVLGHYGLDFQPDVPSPLLESHTGLLQLRTALGGSFPRGEQRQGGQARLFRDGAEEAALKPPRVSSGKQRGRICVPFVSLDASPLFPFAAGACRPGAGPMNDVTAI